MGSPSIRLAAIGLVLCGLLVVFTRAAQADTLTASSSSLLLNQTTSILGNVNVSQGQVVSLTVAPGTLVSGSVSTLENVAGQGTGTLSFTALTTGFRGFAGTYVCLTPGPVVFTLSVQGVVRDQLTLTCAAASTTPGCDPYTAAVNATLPNFPCNSCPAGNAVYGGNVPCAVYPFLPTSPCSGAPTTATTFPAPYVSPYGPFPYSNNLPYSTYTSGPTLCPTPITAGVQQAAKTEIAPASKINASSRTSSVGCGETAYLTFEILDAAGTPVVSGKNVTLAVDTGTVSPSEGVETGGFYYAIYKAPASGGGKANVTAMVDGAKGTVTLTLACGQQSVAQSQSTSGVSIQVDQICGVSKNTASFQFSGTDSSLKTWVDLSLQDNGWLTGTFIGNGPLSPGVHSLVWDGLNPGVKHYLRVNQQLANGSWSTSRTYYFDPPVC